MKRLFTLAATLVLIFGMTLSAHAARVDITFDEDGISLGDKITDQYAAYGIYWDATYSNIVSSSSDFNYSFTSEGNFLWYDTKPANGTIQLDTPTEYFSFDFRRPSSAEAICLKIYNTATGFEWNFGQIGWSGDQWVPFTYGGLFGPIDKIEMYAEKKFLIDNFSIDTAYAVPIPPSVLLLGTGLIPLIFRRKSKKS